MIGKKKSKLDIMTCICISMMVIVIAGSVLAPFLSPYDPTEINLEVSLEGVSKEHLLGTDVLGRDLFSRILYGGRVSILLAVAATALSMLVGMIAGLVSGYAGGMTDAVITNITSIFQGLPGTSMMIAMSAILGPGVKSLLLALVVNSWSGFSRIVRGEVMKLKEETFIEGAKSLGAGPLRIIMLYIIPNMISNIIVLFTTRVGSVILSIAGLSFLGLGIQPPTPDWGVMVSEARTHFRTSPMLIIAPGACIMIITFGINYLGEVLREKFDVKNDAVQKY